MQIIIEKENICYIFLSNNKNPDYKEGTTMETTLTDTEYYNILLSELIATCEHTCALHVTFSELLHEQPDLFEHHNPRVLSRVRLEFSLPCSHKEYCAWERGKCISLNLNYDELFVKKILILRKELDGFKKANQQLEKAKAYLLNELEAKKARCAIDHEPYFLMDAVIQQRNLKRLAAFLTSYFQIHAEYFALFVEFLKEPVFQNSEVLQRLLCKQNELEKARNNIRNLMMIFYNT